MGERLTDRRSDREGGGETTFASACTSLVEVLSQHAARHPQRPFLTYLADGEWVDRRLTFGQLDHTARQIARLLHQRGITPGERALLLYPSGPDFVAAFLGCLYAGVVAIPAYPPRNARHLPRIEAILRDADVRAVLTVPDLERKITDWLAGRGERARWALTCTGPESLPDADGWEPVLPGANALAFLQYTSGSTGEPKGVMVTHGNLMANQRAIEVAFGHTIDSTVVSWLPVFHDMGLVGNLMQPLYLGSQVILMAPAAFLQKPVRWLQAVSLFRGRTTGAPNFAFDLTARSVTPEQREALDLSSLELLYNGSEPIDARVLDRFADAFAPCGLRREVLYPCYGMAETTLMSTAWRKGTAPRSLTVDAAALALDRVVPAGEGAASRTLVSCGHSIPGQTLRIVDPETRRARADGEVGEIWVAGPHVTHGYWNREALTEETFRARLEGSGDGPFLRTGDLGFIQGDEVFVAGRLKDVIIIRGRNHYPQDLERTADAAHPALQPQGGAAFVVEQHDTSRLVIAQEVQRGALRGLDVPAVAQAIVRAVAEEFELQVHTVVLLSPLSLPKTSSGKVQRGACRDRFLAGSLDVVGTWTTPIADERPATSSAADEPTRATRRGSIDADAIRRHLLDAIAGRLGSSRDRIDSKAPFSSLGLDSIAVVEVSRDLEAWLGREVSPTALYDYPTIDALCQHLAGAAPRSAASVAPGDDGSRHHESTEPIAIVGIGCRFPGGVQDLASYWRLLRDGVDAIAEVPPDRWDLATLYDADPAVPGRMTTRHGGFLDRVDLFDPRFFGIAPREAAAMDPQQRILLEVAWEALEEGGIVPASLAGSDTGVFVGISTNDYASLPRDADDRARGQMYEGTGNAFSAAAGRLSYLLGLQGPSLAVDTACSSSLVAVHLACRSLRAGESDLAIAAGVNLLLSPDLSVTFSKAGMMAPDGRCKAFDARADGYVRSEGCGVVVLRRLSAALGAGDRIHAVIRGSAVNQDGRSNGFTAPNGPSQVRVIRRALSDASVDAGAVGYVEAHGTGTSLGDPIEAGALAEVFAGAATRVPIGSVKTNLGHLEAAAGMAGLIKTVLVLERGEIPPTLHVTRPNPYVDWSRVPLEVPTTLAPWPDSRRACAGVSSFGFTGTNAHVVLERAPSPAPLGERTQADVPAVLALSAQTRAALDDLVARYRERLATTDDSALDIAWTAGAGRQHFGHRVAVVGHTPSALAVQLGSATPAEAAETVRFAALFTGQGAQFAGMGRRLYEAEPVFREAIDRCDAILRPLRDRPLRSVLHPGVNDSASAIDETLWTQPALFAFEYALSRLWESWGIRWTAVLGHSIGEYVAACLAGVFSVDDGLRLVAERARLMHGLPERGAMTAVFADPATVATLLRGLPRLAVAAINADTEVVVSGDAVQLATFEARASAEGRACRRLTVSHAFHSPLMDPMLDAWRAALGQVRFHPPRIPVVSNVTGADAGDAITTVDYWVEHVRQPVRFAHALRWLDAHGSTHAIEIGPRPLLARLAALAWPDGEARIIPSLERAGDNDNESTVVRQALARAYAVGAAIDWARVHPAGRRVSLPTYPFQRQRYWIAPAPAASGEAARTLTPERGPGRPLPDVATLRGTRAWEIDAATTAGRTWPGYRVDGAAELPAGALVRAVEAAAREHWPNVGAALRDVRFLATAPLAIDDDLRLQVSLRPLGPAEASVEIHAWVTVAGARAWTPVVTARISRDADQAIAPRVPTQADRVPRFGLMFFNGTEAPDRRDNYRLLIEATRFADQHGFSSVWTPERHYTAFGGLYPNPSVLLAALARETRRVRLMAGSLVLPLHHPLRVAEDWSLIDNLSDGRVGISVAPGWNPDDFAMAPDRYADRVESMFREVEVLRRLWRGEAIAARSASGKAIDVRIHPTPIQPELPLWVTAAGNPRTFERAGELGAHLLTHLLDQDIADLAAKIAKYRDGRRRAGHDPDAGQVTVMVHTFLGPDLERVRELTREPYCEYIKANIGLLKGLAFSRGEHLDIASLSPRDLDEFVGFLFERFFATRALLGTPDSCADLAAALGRAGVDEIASLIDFGPPTDAVLESLPHLAALQDRLQASAVAAPRAVAEALEPIRVVQERCRELMPGVAFYQRLASRGIEFGPELRRVDRFWRRDGEALARLATGDGAAGEGAMTGGLDAGLQAFVAAIPAAAFEKAVDGVFVPADLSNLRVLRPGVPAAWAHAVLAGTIDPSETGAFAGAVRLLDDQGVVVAELSGLRVRRRASAPRGRGREDVLASWQHEVRWQEAPPVTARAFAAPGRWIVLADRGGVGAATADRLRAAGHEATIVPASAVDPLDATAVAALVSSSAAGDPPAGILHAWSLDAPANEALSPEGLRDAEARGCGAIVHLVQALAAKRWRCPVWVVTRGAQRTGGGPDTCDVQVAQAPAWGLGRVMALEHPECWGGLIDLDEVAPAIAAATVVSELTSNDGEDQVAYRAGRRLVPRLEHGDPLAAVAPRLDGEATYLITGGVGALGRRVAHWMVKHGARHLVLTGLHALPDRALWTADGLASQPVAIRERVAGVQSLEGQGAEVLAVAGDVSDADAMQALFETVRATGRPLRGLVHLAGLPENQALADVVFGEARRVLAPKIEGAWLVHELSQPDPLDFFVTFSSISAVWGSRGQPLYAAANHFLDALHAHRVRRGLPSTCINWGPWSEGGMVSSEGLQALSKMGVLPMDPADATGIVGRLLASRTGTRVVAHVDWAVFTDLFEARGRRPLLASMREAARSGVTGAPTALRLALQGMDATDRHGHLARHVQQEVGAVLGWANGEVPDTRAGFFELGMDSLTALELKNRLQASLGLALRATVVFNHPRIDALVDFLLRELGFDAVAEPLAAPAPPVPVDVDALDDAAVLQLLDRQLEAIEASGQDDAPAAVR